MKPLLSSTAFCYMREWKMINGTACRYVQHWITHNIADAELKTGEPWQADRENRNIIYYESLERTWRSVLWSPGITCSSSSTTTRVSLFLLKSNRVILGLREARNECSWCRKRVHIKSLTNPGQSSYQKNRPILVSPSNTSTPVGVRPKLYSFPSLAWR